ncbi:septation protein SpoVG family protein [Sporolituus thermophilus]|uniref:SpoVG protein n=1 Tax=Sporolituus thermophilus DSM 23256 TaxID=1123285 RepID=A0A1G7PJD8_9FIRM|nr:septation protein SpoVG family protein [Sporolituus thermophilus]SDF86234.1 SpoVG protein [Sporolituus thermophilus DSM 23256]
MMKITSIMFKKANRQQEKLPGVIAIANIEIENAIVIRDVLFGKYPDDNDKYFLRFPRRKSQIGFYLVAYCVSKEIHEQVIAQVIDAWQRIDTNEFEQEGKTVVDMT